MAETENIDTEQFRARLFRQNERVIKLGLAAVKAAFKREAGLGAPNGAPDYPHIVVAGTNGKGQISALLSNAFTLSGVRCGLYTSPHLVDFCERMRIGGVMIPSREAAQIGMDVLTEYGGDDVPGFSGITLTYFECCLIMACRYFAWHNVGFGIFEVGLGGRLDATNALSPVLSVIASIGFDHEAYLGHTLPEIAREKAGIMRSRRPCVVGRSAVADLAKEAKERGVSSFDALGENFDWTMSGDRCFLDAPCGRYALPGAERMPEFQRDNVAVAAFSLLKAREIGLFAPKCGMQAIFDELILRTRWVGRMWRVSRRTAERFGVRSIVLDGAHNPDGAKAFCAAVAAQNESPRALVVNSCRDKNIDDMFWRCLTVFDKNAIWVPPILSTPRAAEPNEYCARVGLPPAQAAKSCRDAILNAAKCVGADGTIYIAGSLYLLGECLAQIGETDALTSILTDMPAQQ